MTVKSTKAIPQVRLTKDGFKNLLLLCAYFEPNFQIDGHYDYQNFEWHNYNVKGVYPILKTIFDEGKILSLIEKGKQDQQTTLYDIRVFSSIPPEQIPNPVMNELKKRVFLHYDIEEARRIRTLNSLESQILNHEKQIVKQEEELRLLGITLKDVERIGKLIKDEAQLRDSNKLLAKQNRRLSNQLSNTRIVIYQDLEIHDYMMQFSKPERAWLWGEFEKYMIGKYGAPYTAMPRKGSALKIITKENVDSHQRRRVQKEEDSRGQYYDQ